MNIILAPIKVLILADYHNGMLHNCEVCGKCCCYHTVLNHGICIPCLNVLYNNIANFLDDPEIKKQFSQYFD